MTMRHRNPLQSMPELGQSAAYFRFQPMSVPHVCLAVVGTNSPILGRKRQDKPDPRLL
jgi:hypothetical protein